MGIHKPALSVADEVDFSPSCWLLSSEKSSFVLAHNVSIDGDQASANGTSNVHKCQMKTHLWETRGGLSKCALAKKSFFHIVYVLYNILKLFQSLTSLVAVSVLILRLF